jgi:acyl-CoA synthetase (AMP-forming)/AMP-acid ligase II
MAADCLRLNKVDAIALIPPFVEEIARNQKLLDFLSHEVEVVFWGGGDISKDAGEAFSSKFKLFTVASSTEMGFSPTLRRRDQWQSDRWKYMRFHPAMNLKFHHHVDDLFEGRIQRNPSSEYQQPIFRMHPNLQEYCTGDLFSSHPLESELWQYRGRTDDMQIFLSGSNYHPATLEQRIAQHPDVQDALFVGTGRPHAALLLEMKVPPESSSDRTQLLEKLWPTIEEANQICPAFAKITKPHVLFVTAEKPMVRSGKKTIQRPATVQLYEEELNGLLETPTT